MRIIDISPDAGSLGSDLLALQHAAYAVEANLIGDNRIPPLHETLEQLVAEQLRWLGAFDHLGLVGAVGWSETRRLVDIDRLAVDPAAHRRGIGAALVEAVMTRARDRRIVVATGKANTRPAPSTDDSASPISGTSR